MERRNRCRRRNRQGLTIIEMSVVLAVLLMLASMVFISLNGMEDWKKAKLAGEQLREVYLAQKTYLADNPTDTPAVFSDQSLLVPYLPSGATSIPVVETLTGATPGIDCTQMPPIINGPYDPSGDTQDTLWDVGKP